MPSKRAITSGLAVLLISILVYTPAACTAVCVPDVQLKPSLERPFIYIHQRKTGGTSIRSAALAGAEGLSINSSAFIPCLQDVHCGTFAPDPAQQRFSIYAGHFNWYTVVPDKGDFACLTSFRHPLERAVSCLYFRFPEKMLGVTLRNMSSAHFRGLLLDTYHDSNSSCNNEAVLMLSRVADAQRFGALLRDRDATSNVVREAIANVKKCVVLVHGGSDDTPPDATTDLGAWNTRILTHFFPWLPEVGREMVNPHPQLPAHLVSAVYELNWPELLVYQAALRQFRAQQRVLGSAQAAPRRVRPVALRV